MDDVKLIADHWLRLSEDKKNLPDPITEADRRRRDRLRKSARAASSSLLHAVHAKTPIKNGLVWTGRIFPANLIAFNFDFVIWFGLGRIFPSKDT